MAETLHLIQGSREEKYKTLVPQLRALIADETDLIANCGNIAAALRQTFGFFWIGFYFVRQQENSLVLGPFQGDIACTRIGFGKGVCGTAWQKAETILVPDVELFEGHIACSSASKSEIVVPIIFDGIVRSVLDIDSDQLNDFTQIDKQYLEEIAKDLAYLFSNV
jgi:L-methionine (R)-S-oxide reductase